MKTKFRHLALWALATLAMTTTGMVGGAVEPPVDVRRDATVEAVEKAMPCVVNIATATLVERNDPYYRMMREFYGDRIQRQVREEPASSGSGVIIDEDGYLITNIHVIQGATKIQVKLADERVYEAQALVGIPNSDVALLKIRSKAGEKFKAIKLAKDDDLLLGETVIAIGNPYGLEGSVSRGILSAKSRRQPGPEGKLTFENWLQTDAAINPGNSGGALVNLRGELIGLNVAVYRETQGMGVGFAIPVKMISAAVTEFFTPEDLPVEGRTPLWFGAKFKPAPYPLSITEVRAGTPAEQAGLRAGQVVLQINGQTPRSPMDCAEILLNSPNRAASIVVVDSGTRRELKVKLVNFDEFFRQKIGASLAKLTTTDVERFGLNPGDGVFLQTVTPDGPADRAQLQPGFLLSKLDGRAVLDLSELASLLSTKPAGGSVQATVRVPERNIYGYTSWRQGTTTLKLR